MKPGPPSAPAQRATAHVHEDLARTQEIAAPGDRSFGLVFAALFCGLALWPLARGATVHLPALAVSGAFLLAALLRPSLLAPLNRAWFRLGGLLHRIASPVVLGLIFFGVLLPIALLMRVVGSRPLALGFDRGARTYWMQRTITRPDPETLKRQF